MNPQSIRVILLLLTLITTSSLATAEIIVDPGTTSAPIQATQCAHASRGLFGGECTVDCIHACDLLGNRAQAWMSLESLDVGSRYITSTIYTEFQVSSTSETVGNTVSSSLIYNVEWLGWWYFASAILDWDPHVTITLWMTDRTSGQATLSEVLHTVDVDTFATIDIVEVGVGRDMDSISGESHVNLVRGHTYRVHLSIKLEATAVSSGVVTLDYLGGSGNSLGAWWNELKVNIAPDLAERIDLLEGRVEVLEGEVERLQEDLENHTHTYQTGRGQGHNSVEAESSPAIIADP